MSEVGVREAKAHFSELLRRVATGEKIVITDGGIPVAELVPPTGRRRRVLGSERGRLKIPDDFDAPLPNDVLDTFYQ